MMFLTSLLDPKRIRLSVMTSVLFFALLMVTSQSVSAETNIDDLKISYPDKQGVKIELLCQGTIRTDPAFYDNPPRLVFDFGSTTLRYNKGQTKRISVQNGNLKSIAIAQFQVNPNIARLVLYFASGSERSLLNEVEVDSKSGKITITYPKSGSSTAPEKPQKEKPSTQKQVIEKLYHKVTGTESDGFIMMSSKPIRPSSSKFVSGKLILNFENFAFDIPKDSEDKNKFDVSLSGSVIDKINMINRSEGASLELQIKKPLASVPIEYQLSYPNETELRLDIVKSSDDSSSTSEKPFDEKKFQRFDEGLVTQILGGETIQQLEMPIVTNIRISRIKYVPTSIGERFIFEVTGGDLNPVFEYADNPPMLSMRVLKVSVATPKESSQEYSVQVDGEFTKEMKITQRYHGEIPESLVLLYFDSSLSKSLQHDFYLADKSGVYHLDIMPVNPGEIQNLSKRDTAVKRDVDTGAKTDSRVESGADSVGYRSSDDYEIKEISEKTGDAAKPIEKTGDQIFRVPRVSGGNIDEKSAESIHDNSKIKTVPIPKSDDDINPFEIKASSTDDSKSGVEVGKEPEFPLGKVFLSPSESWSSGNFPLMMIVLFNKEKGSYVLYMIYFENGKLKFEQFP